MRAYAKRLVVLGFVSAAGLVHAVEAANETVPQSQTPAPPEAPQPFQIRPFQEPPRKPLFPLQPLPPSPPPLQQRQAGQAPCVNYPMRMLPANPNVDPKMIVRRPPGAPAVEYRMPEVQSNRCR